MERKKVDRETEVLPESYLGLNSKGPARLPDRAYPNPSSQQQEKSRLEADSNRRRS